jgi:hypothetical protein
LNVLEQWVTLMLRTGDVTFSNLGLDTNYVSVKFLTIFLSFCKPVIEEFVQTNNRFFHFFKQIFSNFVYFYKIEFSAKTNMVIQCTDYRKFITISQGTLRAQWQGTYFTTDRQTNGSRTNVSFVGFLWSGFRGS